MTPDQVHNELVRIVHGILKGSRRTFQPDDTIGPEGAGLDSLATMEFVLAVENRFGVQIPDTVWQQAPALTFREIGRFVTGEPRGHADEPPIWLAHVGRVVGAFASFLFAITRIFRPR